MLIGVNGQIGSGKDALFERAAALYESDTTLTPARPERTAFADKLKRAFAALFGITREFIEEAKRDDLAEVFITTPRFGFSRRRGLQWTRFLPGMRRVHSHMTVRMGLQRMGTEVGRQVFGDSFWVDQCVPLDLDHTNRAIFVTDCRFPNEVQRIRDAGGLVVRVLNGPLTNDDGHPSEQILPSEMIDVEVDNSRRDDGFAALDAQVEQLLSRNQSGPQPAKSNQRELPPRTLRAELPLDAIRRPSWTSHNPFPTEDD